MPFITVKVIKDAFTREQKDDIIKGMTDAMVAIEGEAMRGVTWVVIEEVQGGDWGIGGQQLHAADVHAMQAAGAAG